MISYRRSKIIQNLDWATVIMYIMLLLFGWFNIYGASYNFDQTSIFDFGNRAGKQFVWIIGALLLGSIMLWIDCKVYDVLSYFLYGVMIVVLLLTPLLARDIKGSLSWLSIGPISIQPAEFAKCITALALAKYMGRYTYRVRSWRDLTIPFLLIGLPACIIMILQKETGSALVFASFLLVLYRQGMSGFVLWCGVLAVVLFIVSIRFGAVPLPIGQGSVGILTCMLLLTIIEIGYIRSERHNRIEMWSLVGGICMAYAIGLLLNIWFIVNFNLLSIVLTILLSGYAIGCGWYSKHYKLCLIGILALGSVVYTQACDFVFTQVLQPHQRVRIEVLFGMKEDPTGAGYNVNQARIAIGSGGWLGKGYLNGTQTKLQFVPEQDTDFIFCTVGEEWGFVGSVVVLLLYLLFILRLIGIAERQRDMFSRIYGYSVAAIFLFHFTINIGMVLGLLPVIGIPLPFFSYGGSSLWGFTILLFILLRLDIARVEKLH